MAFILNSCAFSVLSLKSRTNDGHCSWMIDLRKDWQLIRLDNAVFVAFYRYRCSKCLSCRVLSHHRNLSINEYYLSSQRLINLLIPLKRLQFIYIISQKKDQLKNFSTLFAVWVFVRDKAALRVVILKSATIYRASSSCWRK